MGETVIKGEKNFITEKVREVFNEFVVREIFFSFKNVML